MPSSSAPNRTIRVKRCFAFPDGDEWLVFAPQEGVLFRANEAAAQRLDNLAPVEQSTDVVGGEEGFAPRHVTVSTSSLCTQRCIYCYGTPAHKSPHVIDVGFCEAGCDFVAANAAAQGQSMVVNFHGMGEPTIPWRRFAECVHCTEKAAAARGVRLRKSIFTGGQLSADQAHFIADHFEVVHVSLDGPEDIQRAQRPRRDGLDPFGPALQTARIVRESGRSLTVNATVVDAIVDRMVEITEFVGRDIGPGVVVEFQDVLAVPWREPGASVPQSVQQFLASFRSAVSVGSSIGVTVLHADISVASLMLPGLAEGTHMCLTPYNNVVAFYDLPHEGGGTPDLGAYGQYDRRAKALRFDHEKRRALEAELRDRPCTTCICGRACGGRAWVKGRLALDDAERETSCRIRQGVAREFLRRAAREGPAVATSEWAGPKGQRATLDAALQRPPPR